MTTMKTKSEPFQTILDPGTYREKIDQLWVFVSSDKNGEGICGYEGRGLVVPLFASDQERLDQIRPLAKRIAQITGQPVKLIKFTCREELEVIEA